MSTRRRRSMHEYEPLPRLSSDSDSFPTFERNDNPSWLRRLSSKIPGLGGLVNPSTYVRYVTPRRRKRSLLRLLLLALLSAPLLFLFFALVATIFFPSYTNRPTHYDTLRQHSLRSNIPGRANPNNEKVFIAAAIFEEKGELTSGAWGKAVLDLVDLLGPQNVHLSIYENDADAVTQQSLTDLKERATCDSTIVFEDLDLSTLPRITLPTGATHIKRIAFLAEVRNRALAPLDASPVKFDKVLYVNDVYFDPIEAAQLLLSTNVDANGRASYNAACAVDFINPFKFYDRFATRDLEGYGTGVPFFPWFTSAGDAMTRKDVLAGTDAVRVRSCWGGMTAYEAKWFQNQTSSNSDVAPLRFRYDESTFWESSECCLINADLQFRSSGVALPADSGIYMNPFIRVAYDTKTLSWLSLSRRHERLYTLFHEMLNHVAGFPTPNARRLEKPGDKVTDTVWEYDDFNKGLLSDAKNEDFKGHYAQVPRVANVGGFCGGAQLLVINENPGPDEGRWGKIFAPHPPA